MEGNKNALVEGSDDSKDATGKMSEGNGNSEDDEISKDKGKEKDFKNLNGFEKDDDDVLKDGEMNSKESEKESDSLLENSNKDVDVDKEISESTVNVEDSIVTEDNLDKDPSNVEPPEDWVRKASNSEVHFISPTGEKLYSLDEVKKHCETHSISVDYKKFSFKPLSGHSNSTSPLPTHSENGLNSDSQNSSDTPSNKSSEKKTISTSALLRAYRPHLKPGGVRSATVKNQASPTHNQTTRNSTVTPPRRRKNDLTDGSASEPVPSLNMECKTEALSAAQFNKIKKLQDDLARLHFLLTNNAQQGDKNGGAPPMVNGTLGTSVTGSQSLTNGTNLIGVQVPQFLLLQNGQMIGASAVTPSSQPLPVTSAQAVQSTAKGTRSVNSSSKNTTSKTSHESSSASTRPQRSAAANASSNASGRSSPDIQVLREMRTPTHVQGTTSSGTTNSATSVSSGASSSMTKNFPLLAIVCRPKNTLSPGASFSQRKELDVKVKSVLVKSAQEFVEWLLSEGMIRTSQFCSLHKVQASQSPFKLKLGMFSDPKVLSTSGGYVWISECCGKKYVSVYSGSIFGSTPIDKVPPTAVLKLVYHWSCQTSIANVESWVKVEKNFINKMYNYLRCVCSVMLQDKVYDFGFDGTTVELGIVSLGTSTADGTKKAVKVEILGLFDRKMKSYRLFASEPEPGSSSRQRFVRILKPLERVVHNNAILLCDQSVDRNCLYNMNYGKVSVCETSDNEDNLQSNATIMTYLRRHVPKMFQSTLSQLSLQQVQIVLDELCWRERFGHCAAQAYTVMVEHITYLTSREAENPGVLHLLDFVAQKPQHNWRYKSQHVPKVTPALQPSIIMSTPTLGTINPQVTMDIPHHAQSPLDHTNKVALTPRTRGVTTNREPPQPIPVNKTLTPVNTNTNTNSNSITPKPDAVELEPFYYGQVQGDTSLGREINNYSYTCHLCTDTFAHNVDFYTHMRGHVGNKSATNIYCCDYCCEHFESPESRDYHHKFRHLQMDTRYTWCRICTESFPGEFQLVNHMAKKHYESELPYRCEVCNFMTSIYYTIINHFRVEHKDSPYVQCHYCLTVKTINSSSAASFSTRILQHLQKHVSQQGKCKSCSLSFYSKYLLDDHKRKDHVSRINITGLQRYKIPVGHNRIMFRPWVKRGAVNNTQMVNLQASNTVAISSTLQRLDSLSVDVGEEDKKFYCIECDGSLTLDQHFRAYQKCTKCAYSTCCRNMISKHAQVFHPMGKIKSGYYRIGPPIVLPKSMYCICGFSSLSGNHLARHLAICEGGRKSAYPSMLDAMVYRGDPMTPSAMALSSLGLSRMLPGSVTPAVPDPSEPSLDLNHFMSVQMEVDEDDPPEMPVSVELRE